MSYMRTVARDLARKRMTGVFPEVNKQMDKVNSSGNKYWRIYTEGKFQNGPAQVIPAEKATKKKFKFSKAKAKA